MYPKNFITLLTQKKNAFMFVLAVCPFLYFRVLFLNRCIYFSTAVFSGLGSSGFHEIRCVVCTLDHALDHALTAPLRFTRYSCSTYTSILPPKKIFCCNFSRKCNPILPYCSSTYMCTLSKYVPTLFYLGPSFLNRYCYESLNFLYLSNT
ncbi:hypothetical protein C2G38_1729209 [Gigaspora rosea]|uniref:Uncharacterized protein n=1 Tax=Gigaspora rosea TaxID=44941 RepID=A0A397UXN9_9GLOM|nr:hypothetical protein C2G38_1729209 [Gigaspora rosea]